MLIRCMQLSNVLSSIQRLKDFFASERSIESDKRLTAFSYKTPFRASRAPFSATLEGKINETFMASLPASKSWINSAMWSSTCYSLADVFLFFS